MHIDIADPWNHHPTTWDCSTTSSNSSGLHSWSLSSPSFTDLTVITERMLRSHRWPLHLILRMILLILRMRIYLTSAASQEQRKVLNVDHIQILQWFIPMLDKYNHNDKKNKNNTMYSWIHPFPSSFFFTRDNTSINPWFYSSESEKRFTIGMKRKTISMEACFLWQIDL